MICPGEIFPSSSSREPLISKHSLKEQMTVLKKKWKEKKEKKIELAFWETLDSFMKTLKAYGDTIDPKCLIS